MSSLPHCYRHPDRETGLSCSECGRPICTECVTYAPVGLRCPDHSGKPQGKAKVAAAVGARGDDSLTRLLIALNVGIFLAEIATGASLNNFYGSTLAAKLAVDGPDVANGEWWRIVTSGFIHYGILHLAMNMYALYLLGGSLERIMGRGRFLIIYLASLVAGSAGALLLTSCAATGGASGAIFGLLGAALVLERQKVIAGGNIIGILVINLAFTLGIPGISIGGHLGGFVGGALVTLLFSRFGRGHALYGKLGLVGGLGSLAVIVFSSGLAIWTANNVYSCFRGLWSF
ncbi:MAG: hypothetical protein QOH73_171 [Gaiellaceae bacterium]|jgi:membrane associated rhomboid family serine protease|nr:hypothetical protein [Gaiellaceae bacterium]